MPSIGGGYENRSKEWRYWRAFFKAKGCGPGKVEKLACKKMGWR